MRTIRGNVRIMLLLAVALTCAVIAAAPVHAGEKKIKTYYTGIDLVGTGMNGYTIRYKVTSYYLGRQISYTRKREIGEIRNTTKKAATKTLSLSKSTTRTYSISASTVIPKRVLQNDISVTIGGSLSFNNTITISASASVPPGRSRSVFLQYKKSKDRYKYVVQKQTKSMYGKWKNLGKLELRYNTSTTKVPVLVI